MHAKSGGSSGEPPDFLFIPAACRSRKDLPRSAGGGDRARNTGNRPRDAEDGATGTGTGRGAGCGAAGAGCGARGAGAEHGRRGRRAQDAKRGTRGRGRGHGHGVQDAGRRTQNAEHGLLAAGSRTRETGARSAEDGRRGHGVQDAEHGLLAAGSRTRETRARGAGDGAQAPVHGPQRDCIHPPGPATTCRDRSQPGAIRRGPHPTCRAYESESRRCRRARRTCCCRAAPRPT